MQFTRRRRISAANSGPNLFHQKRTVSWQMSTPHSDNRSSTFPQRQRVPDIQRHRHADHPRRRVETAERIGRPGHFSVLPAPCPDGSFSLTGPLNLQRLGAQINIDLPWNPSRLEQRKGRVQRIGQVRDEIHVVNLRYAGTVEDDVYAAPSARLGNIFSVMGQLF